jgi:signal transduction histidine kinase
VQLAVLAALGYWVLSLLAGIHAMTSLAVLAPSAAEQLAERVAVLTRTRVDVLDAHGAELRRIERDLHDGTQARLVAIAMQLAVAREALPGDPQRVAELLREAHEGTEEAMSELREVVRTIYPPILSDRGLAGALRTVATRGGVPAQVVIGDLGRIPAAVEAVVYHAVTELLTNVSKHSRAMHVAVRVDTAGDRLAVTVSDDGIGGADDASGTGLAGIRRRVRALDGTVRITSPAGGPTAVTVEVPCGW